MVFLEKKTFVDGENIGCQKQFVIELWLPRRFCMQLKRAMGLRDLVLFNVVAILGLRWISTAATTGIGSILLWTLALLFSFIPQAVCVNILSKKFPEEGGIYVWSKKGFGDYHGFMSGFCYWVNN